MSKSRAQWVEPPANQDATRVVCYGSRVAKRVADGALINPEATTEAGVMAFRVDRQTVLDRYKARKQLGDEKQEERRYNAGTRLYADWFRGARQPSVVAQMGDRIIGAESTTEVGARARERYIQAVRALGPKDGLSHVLIHVCCLDHSAEDWARTTNRHPKSGMEILRIALDALADHYGL